MSFKLGKIQILLAAVGVIIALIERSSPAMLITCATIFFVFLATPLSRFLWDGLSVLQMVQFPWRSLGLVSILMSWLAGYTVGNIRSLTLRIGFVILMITSLFALNLKYFTPQTLIAPPNPQRDIASVVPEYMPRWMPTPPLPPAGPHERAYYPTWKVLVDGRSVPTSPNESGILTYSILLTHKIYGSFSLTHRSKICLCADLDYNLTDNHLCKILKFGSSFCRHFAGLRLFTSLQFSGTIVFSLNFSCQ